MVTPIVVRSHFLLVVLPRQHLQSTTCQMTSVPTKHWLFRCMLIRGTVCSEEANDMTYIRQNDFHTVYTAFFLSS